MTQYIDINGTRIYEIKITGGSELTKIIVDLNDDEFKAVKRIARLSQAKACGYSPKIEIEESYTCGHDSMALLMK
jgi:hypothetical protein